VGLEPVARRLEREGCHTFFVASAGEGVELRSLLANVAIYVLDGVTSIQDSALLVRHRLLPVLNSTEQLKVWHSTNQPCALMFDTGINRLGLPCADAATSAGLSLNVTLLLSHLASADDPSSKLNALQVSRFNGVRDYFPKTPASLANSAGILLGAEFQFDMVRPGLALYGGFAGPPGSNAVSSVVTAEAQVLQVSTIAAGETVGYNGTWTALVPTRLATIGLGYADGYLRSFSNCGEVWLANRRCPVRGRVSMDLTIVEIGDAAVSPGDYAELFGKQISLQEAAIASGLSQYELLTGLGPRYVRIYLG
jgi:alanine racemase